MKTGYNKGMIDQLRKFLEDEFDNSAAIKRWSMQVSAFLKTALGADEADNFLKLNDPNEYDEYALRCGHLQGLIAKSEAEIYPAKSGKDPVPATSVGIAEARRVFVVHGRDGRLRDDFFSFLRTLGLQPIEWSEALKFTGRATPYIGEALESAFKNAQAVIVLLSPDDEVRLSPELWKDKEDKNEKENRLQARPNVLFEAGMAFGTHPDRTLLVEVGQVKAFSDVAGRYVVRLSNLPAKRNEIAERLRTAGCDVSKSGNDWLKTGNFTVTREKKNDSIHAYVGAEKNRKQLINVKTSAYDEAYKNFTKILSHAFGRYRDYSSGLDPENRKYTEIGVMERINEVKGARLQVLSVCGEHVRSILLGAGTDWLDDIHSFGRTAPSIMDKLSETAFKDRT